MIRPRRVTLTSHKLVRQRRRKRSIFLLLVVGSLGVAIAAIIAVSRSPFLLIDKVLVEGNEVVGASQIELIANEILNQKHFFLIPKNNRLIYPKEEIETEIRRKVGRIETLSLDVEKRILRIKISERGSYGLWCKSEGSCFFMDSEGLIFATAPVFSSGVYKIFTGVVGDENPIGKQFLDAEKITVIKRITDFIDQQGFKSSRIEVTTLRDALLVQSKGPTIKIDLTKPVENTIKVLKTLLASEEFKKATKDISTVDYIDARFGNKVFFKPKNSILPAAAAPSSV